MSDERQKTLTGRVAVITGGASGIGRAVAVLFARHGARVFVGDFSFLADEDAPRLNISQQHIEMLSDPNTDPNTRESIKREIESAKRLIESTEQRYIKYAALTAELRIRELPCDVRREADVQRLIDTAVAEAGRIDILINNAGIGMVKQITEVTEADWSACLDTNLKGAFFAAKHAVRHMQRTGGGVIINNASNAGLLPRTHDPVYSISKGALVALTKSLALCHAKDRIRVNCVCPGPVGGTRMMNRDLDAASDRAATEKQFIAASPLAHAHGRMIAPEEVAQAMLYLASDAAAMVTGTSIAIDGGKSLGVPPKVS